MPVRSDFSFFESLTSGHRRRFYEYHRLPALLMILILLLVPFAGLYVPDLLGLVVGVLPSVAAYYLRPPLRIMYARSPIATLRQMGSGGRKDRRDLP